MKPLITIGIPTYKADPYLYNAINSAIKQNYDNYEILIYNDSGNPNLKDIKEVEREFSWHSGIRFVHGKKNLGIGGARNALINNAKGEYIMFLSDDDELIHNCITEMFKFSKKNKNSFIYCNYFVMDGEGNLTREYKVKKDHFKEEEFKKYVLYFANQNSMFVCYNIFGPTNLWKKNHFDSKLRYLEDYEHLLRCVFLEDVQFSHLPKTLFKYTMRKGSTTTQNWKDLPRDDLKIRLKLNKKAGKNILNDEIWES